MWLKSDASIIRLEWFVISISLYISSLQLSPFITNTFEAGRDSNEIERIMKSTIRDHEMAWACTIITRTYISTSIHTNPHIIHLTTAAHIIAVSLVAAMRGTIIHRTAAPCGKQMTTIHRIEHPHDGPWTPYSMKFLSEIQFRGSDQWDYVLVLC